MRIAHFYKHVESRATVHIDRLVTQISAGKTKYSCFLGKLQKLKISGSNGTWASVTDET